MQTTQENEWKKQNYRSRGVNNKFKKYIVYFTNLKEEFIFRVVYRELNIFTPLSISQSLGFL